MTRAAIQIGMSNRGPNARKVATECEREKVPTEWSLSGRWEMPRNRFVSVDGPHDQGGGFGVGVGPA